MKLLFRFNALRHTSLVFLLWWDKRWKPLSLTPVASRALMTKSWYCQELDKISFLMQTVNQITEKV